MSDGISRRSILAAGGAGVGLLLLWGAWPRRYRHNLSTAPGEHVVDAYLKIGEDGHVAVVVPQAEMGQGVWTGFAQIVADELGADWRTVSVEPAPINPLYANRLIAEQAAEAALPGFLDGLGRRIAGEGARRTTLMMTGGSTSIRGFERDLRQAGAAGRVLLCMAAAKRWGIDWQACDTAGGFVVRGPDRLRFGELAAEAAGLGLPESLPLRDAGERPMTGQALPRLDLPAKVDGSALFAGDIRLPGMVFASIRHAPLGDSRLVAVDHGAADRVPGAIAIVENPGWAAAIGETWWAAEQALAAAHPRFATRGPLPDSRSVDAALRAALADRGRRIVDRGDVEGALAAGAVAREYSVGFAPHAPIEPMVATARMAGDRLELWLPTQAPAIARAAAARAIALPEGQVSLFPTFHGGSFGRKVETDAAEQVAVLAAKTGKPVQLTWPRAEEARHDRMRPPALGRLIARTAANGIVTGWHAAIAAPATDAELMARLTPGLPRPGGGAGAVEGAVPPYAIPALAVDHHRADIGVATGMLRSVAHSYTAFFTESFIDELAERTHVDPLSFRMQMLGIAPRLAHCLSLAATLGGWEGGGPGSAQGLACHSAFGSHVAMLAEVHVEGGRVVVDRIAAAVDCGTVINPTLVRQQIEGGILFGLALALARPVTLTRGLVDQTRIADLGLPTLADTPEILVELVPSRAPSGGVGEIAVPPVAPAVANALAAATGQRLRTLPVVPA